MSLANYYAGDAAWEDFAAVWAEHWQECDFKDALLKATHSDQLLAQTIYGVVGKNALEWIESPVPALGNKTPASRLKSKRGVLAVRECLLRSP